MSVRHIVFGNNMTLTKLALFAVIVLCFKQITGYEFSYLDEDSHSYIDKEGDEETQLHSPHPYFNDDETRDHPEHGYGYYGYPPPPSYPDYDPSMFNPEFHGYNGTSVRPSFMSMINNMYPPMSMQSDAPVNGTMPFNDMHTMPYPPPMYMPHAPHSPRHMMPPVDFHDGEMQRPVMPPSEMLDIETDPDIQ